MDALRIYMGNDTRERRARHVAEASFYAHRSNPAGLRGLDLLHLREAGLYTRPTETRNGRLWDTISAAPMTTEHALARFLVPHLAEYRGWALFTDSDILWRADPRELFALKDDRYAVMVVQHKQRDGAEVKKDGAPQVAYPRKNWSSVCLWNCWHPANAALTVAEVNTRPGLWLHGFEWLQDVEIGALPPEWNHLVGVDAHNPDAKLAHFTLGTPDVPGCGDVPFADEWRSYTKLAGVAHVRA